VKEFKSVRIKRRGFWAFERKSPPFAEKREGWGTLKYGGRGFTGENQ
jgi:hypothetical protein